MSTKLWVLIIFGVYVFITLLVYFVMCLINEDNDEEDNIFLSICWPLYAPFWVVRKSAEYVRRGIEKNEEDDDAE